MNRFQTRPVLVVILLMGWVALSRGGWAQKLQSDQTVTILYTNNTNGLLEACG